ncbi:MAG: EamA family transporter [Parvibaculum sp.]|jgi:multidrug transporter EmrE-like cation transporter|uniref:EamA family transporter n=1 Tax=Parvibaculum sp. TaxID=2024848 RepID=UPI00283F9034|nr:EamA family transporter [Parvibaculum sp.]MDR3500490.1 EamA family transporter [Parvibaculum sp.]
MTRALPLIFTGVMLNAIAQLALKQGMRQIGHFEFTPAVLWDMSWRIGTNGYVIFGLACYVVSVAVWLLALSRVDVGFAYPMLSVGYIVTAIFAYYFFGEALTPIRIAGIVVIMAGVFLISRT